MKNNFLQEAYGGLREARSKHYCLGLPRKWKVMTSTLLLLFTFAIGQMWGTCDPGTIFKFEVKDGLTSGNIAKGDPIDLSSYVTVTAGSVSAYGKNDGSLAVVETKAISIAKKAEAYFIFTLSEGCSLQEGDIIKYIVYNKNALLQPETTTSDAAEKLTLTKTSDATTYGTVVIPAEHALIGESTFYLFTGDNSCKIKSVEISRPATITLDATTNGGTVGTTSIKGAIGDKVGLPHAFKTGKKFKGWYTTADGDVKKDDAYTIAGDVTLYAQFEDLPVSGEMFSLTMEDDLKPAAQCTIVSVVSKANQLLSPVELTRYATISGGSAVLSNSSTNNHAFISNSTASAILNGGNGCLTITLESALQVGDVITTSIASQNIAYTVEATRSTATNFVKGDDQTLTVTSESPLKGKSVIYLWSGSSNGGALKSITITRPTPHTLSYAISPDHDPAYATVTLGATSLVEGATTTATYSAIDAAYEFDEWQISGTGAGIEDASANPVVITMGSANATVTLKLKAAVTKYTITYSKGAYGTGDAIPDGKKDAGVDFTLSDDTYSRDGYVQTGWATEDGGAKAYELGGTYSTDADEELFPFWTPVYTVTKGAHDHGDFTISPASLVAGGTVTLDPTPADGYMFSAWEVVKTSDASATGITVTNKQFEMPAYGVTVNATFVADTRKKVLYLTTTNEATTIANDKLYAALKDDYKVTIAAPDAQTLTNYDLVVLHESINGKAAAPDDATNRKQAILDAKTTSVPVLNTKTYFYNSGRWDWGTPNNGQADQRTATLNSGYCNVADHPIFAGVTITAGAVTVLTDGATGNTMQPVEPSSGKEGYLLATTPNKEGGESSYAIQEIPAGGFRGASSGKYILISVSNAGLNNLTADGQKLFQNAAAYLIDGSAFWTPVAVPTSPVVAATPTENYTEGGTITLTASAEGTSASTVYTWYKGPDWATASATTPVQAASTSGATFSKTAAVEDAGTYWCNISNGTSCDAQASVTITVSSASTPTHTISYDNVKGADMTAYPTEYTEGIGVASFDPLADITGWHFVEWSPASIATDATTDQTITAVWAQVFEVTFNLQGHGAEIAKQDIISGEKATEPTAPSAIGYDFGGWFTNAECTAGNEFDFETPIAAATPLYAKWTAFDGCTLLVPATTGATTIYEGDEIDMQTGSKGATVFAVTSTGVVGTETTLHYNQHGLSFEQNGGTARVKVTLDHELAVGSKISLKLMANGNSGSNRALDLYKNTTKVTSIGWKNTDEYEKFDVETFTYTVTNEDGLAGEYEFYLYRNNSVILEKLTIESCGDAITFHNLTSAITPDHDPAYATVTLGATSVREGYTTTAEYSAIDPAYEFVSWSISGAGASIADATANPATITMGTEDAVVTLNLQLIPVKFTVNYFDGTTAMGTEQVVVNEHPTASEIKTAKRGYIFEGWAMSSTATASDVVALNTITSDVAATINLYAVYSEFPCPTSGNLFTWVIDPDADEIVYNVVKNVETEMVTAADVMTITGGTVAVGTTSNSATFTIVDGAFKFRENSNNYTRIELNCALQVGDVISYTSDNSANRYMSIYKDDMSGTAVTTAVDGTRKYFVASTESPIYGAYVLYIKGSNSDCSFKTLSIDRLAPATGVSLENATIAIGNTVTPTMTLLPSNDAYYESIAWSIVGEGEGTIANIDAGTGAVTALAAGSVTVQVKLNNDESLKATCTVEVISSFDQVDVTESTVWDMNNVSANAIELTGDDKNARLLLANIDGVNNNSSFNSQALMFEGQHIGRTPTDGVKHLAGRYVQFNVTKQGVVSVIFASNGDNQRTIRINDKKCTKTTNSGTYITYDVLVQPGSVEIVGMEGASDNQYIRISKITYTVKETPDYSRTEMLGNGVLGTICLRNNVPAGAATGATFYELDGKDANGKMVFAEVDELVAGVPYIFEAHGDRIDCFYGETHVDDPENDASKALKGTFTGITFNVGEADNIYFFRDHALWSAKETGVQILANRAWMDMSVSVPTHAPKPGKRYISMGVQGQNAATGMDELNASEAPVKMLIDGQLFILRGEKMYNANGQLVK